MKIDIFSATSLNGILTSKKGKSSMDIIKEYKVPRKLLELQYDVRKNYDAIMVGTSTVIIDNPQLNSHSKYSRVARITFDPYEKIPKDFNFLDGGQSTYVGVCECTNPKYFECLKRKGIVIIEAGKERIDFQRFFNELKKQGINSVLVEGGGRLNSELIKLNLVSEVHSIIMPFLFGTDAPNFFDSTGLLTQLELLESKIIRDFLYCRYKVKF